jgi:hypothetical protein
MIRLFILYRIVNRANNREYFGVHATEDFEWGTATAKDTWRPSTNAFSEDLRVYGGSVFSLEPIRCFADERESSVTLSNILKTQKPYYNSLVAQSHSTPQIGNKYALGYRHSDAVKQKLSEDRSGSGNPMHGRNHSDTSKSLMAQKKATKRWVNDGIREYQLFKSEPVPIGWFAGRLARKLHEV